MYNSDARSEAVAFVDGLLGNSLLSWDVMHSVSVFPFGMLSTA